MARLISVIYGVSSRIPQLPVLTSLLCFLPFSRLNMDALKKGWFSEVSDMWPGVCLSFDVEGVLHAEKSKFQDIMMIQT